MKIKSLKDKKHDGQNGILLTITEGKMVMPVHFAEEEWATKNTQELIEGVSEVINLSISRLQKATLWGSIKYKLGYLVYLAEEMKIKLIG